MIGGKRWTNVLALKNVLVLFEKIYWLKVNFHKSKLFGINVAVVVMNCKHGCLPFAYLGLVIVGDLRKLQF